MGRGRQSLKKRVKSSEDIMLNSSILKNFTSPVINSLCFLVVYELVMKLAHKSAEASAFFYFEDFCFASHLLLNHIVWNTLYYLVVMKMAHKKAQASAVLENIVDKRIINRLLKLSELYLK